MPEDFQQTVDLREKIERRRDAPGRVSPPNKNITPIEKIYRDDEPSAPIKNLQKISQPKAGQPRESLFRLLVFILAILVVGATVYFLFFKEKGAAPAPSARDWYAVKLVDGEIFYGQVADVKADPVFIANVYYNYDQTKPTGGAEKTGQSAAETGLSADLAGNLRLVKRGKETHGPDGSMNVVRAQVLFMEALKPDSKVLQAILEYEK